MSEISNAKEYSSNINSASVQDIYIKNKEYNSEVKRDNSELGNDYNKEVRQVAKFPSTKIVNKSFLKKSTNDNRRKSKLKSINLTSNLTKNTIQNHFIVVALKEYINKALDSYPFIGFMMSITIYVLFISDIKSAFLTKEVDPAINISQAICFGLFSLELILASIAQKNYLFSFFFWLDLISTISLIQDIDFMFAPILALFNSEDDEDSSTTNGTGNKATTQSIVKAASAGRVTRILRVVRIIRLIRIVKLYKTTMQTRDALAKKKLQKLLKNRKSDALKKAEKLDKSIKIQEEKEIKRENERIKNEFSINVIKEQSKEESIKERTPRSSSVNFNNFNNSLKNSSPIHSRKFSENKDNNAYHKLSQASQRPDIEKIERIINLTEKPLIEENTERKNGINNSLKSMTNQLENKAIEQSNSYQTASKEEKIDDLIKESNISKLLSDSITKKLIILILGMILGLQIISEDIYLPDTVFYNSLLTNYIERINNFNSTSYFNFYAKDSYNSSSFFKANYQNSSFEVIDFNEIMRKDKLFANILSNNEDYTLPFVSDSKSYYNIHDYDFVQSNNYSLPYLIFKASSFDVDTVFPIINITLNDNVLFVNNSITFYPYRDSEVAASISRNHNVVIYHSILHDSQLSAILNICKTIFIMILIVFGAVVFENDTKKLVLDPLEIMIEIVEMVEQDPIIAKNAENLKSGIKSQILSYERQNLKKKDRDIEDNYEVVMIKNSIVKISSLLAICFGEAGGDIIKQNLEKGKDFNPMLVGKKKQAIFGFCDIRQFPIVNDALQERTMIYCNQISEIVHSSIDRFAGATNKNIGDSYLSAWRFSEKVEDKDGVIKAVEVPIICGDKKTMNIADQSILGFLQIIIKINSDADILAYKTDPDIIAHPELHNYKVKMGFGLHIGWGIEGAIGSMNKIDASYLSPNVNISARLKEATKQYGVFILISGELFDLCSPDIKNICRLVDIVAVKGSINPVRMYTIDVNIFNLPKDNTTKPHSTKKRYERFMKIKKLIQMESKKHESLTKYVLSTKYFKRLLTLRRSPSFLPSFEKAMDYYIKGEWIKAGDLFAKCNELDPYDGPTKTIYSFIQSQNFMSEKEGEDAWKGYRALTSK